MSKGGIIDNGKEVLDIVDENDNVIGQLSKKEIHDGINILHREIAVLITDSNNNLLLQQRSFKKKYFPGEWTVSAIGHVMSGQSPEEAAHMELKEELGFDTELTFVERRKYITGNHVSLGYLFIGRFPKGVMIVPDKDELEKAGFFSAQDVRKMLENNLIGPHSAETLTKYFSGTFNF